MSMPGMGGQEVFEHLRRNDPGLPVLFTSGYDPSDAAGVLLKETSVAFLQKPYRPGTLGQELSKLLEAAHAA
jgi:CheY-like chemotaxis protein